MINKKGLEPNNEHGGALVIILIVIALFVALSMAYTRMGGGNDKLLSDGQAKIAASEILNYSKSIERAVNRLVANGCSEEEIDFQWDWNDDGDMNDGAGDQNNSHAPSDGSCNVFFEEGAGHKFIKYPGIIGEEDVFLEYGTTPRPWFGHGLMTVQGVGLDTRSELVLLLWLMDSPKNKSVCNAINKQLNLPENHSEGYQTSWIPPFYNNFGVSINKTIGDGPTALYGKSTGCFFNTWGGASYIFYHILIPR